MSDAQKLIGTILTEPTERDAIHIALAPVVATQNLYIGAPLWLVEGSQELVVGCGAGEPLGIVDPFLPSGPLKGERFYMLLMPNTVTSLRHEWEHPAFKPVNDPWIEALAADLGLSYEKLMCVASQYIEHGDYTMDNTERYKDIDCSRWKEFWIRYGVLTGENTSDEDWAPFTCSC